MLATEAGLREIMHAIDASKGWELDLGRSKPYYAFVCVDLITGMDDARPSDTREFKVSILPRRHGGMGVDVLSRMNFAYTVEGFACMLAWIEEQKLRVVCQNANHRWCKLALPDRNLCATCTINLACLGGAEPSSESCCNGPSALGSVELKPLV